MKATNGKVLIFLLVLLVILGLTPILRVAYASEVFGTLTANLPTIVYGALPQECLYGADVVLGCTIPIENTIYINGNLGDWGRQYVLYHELCHWLGEMDEEICMQVATNLSMGWRNE